MSTARDIVAESLSEIGVLADGETPTAQQLTDGIKRFNRMLDSWSTESLLVYNRVEEPFSLVGSQQTYTMGPSGNFNTSRPQMVENVLLVAPGASALDLEITIYNQDQWASITSKGVSSTLPSVVYADNAFPLMNLNFWPIPSAAIAVKIFSWKPLTRIATPDDVISLPPGYEDAIIFNLAARQCPSYGRPISPELVEFASSSREKIKRMNIRPVYLTQDAAVLQRRAPYNILEGG